MSTIVSAFSEKQKENVERGAKLLDEKMPGWEETIGKSMTEGLFHIDNWESCMAGTLEMVRYKTVDDYHAERERRREDGVDEYDPDDLGVYIQLNGERLTKQSEAEDHGFYALANRWGELDELWREQVRKRGVEVSEHGEVDDEDGD